MPFASLSVVHNHYCSIQTFATSFFLDIATATVYLWTFNLDGQLAGRNGNGAELVSFQYLFQ